MLLQLILEQAKMFINQWGGGIWFLVLVWTIFNEGAYLSQSSILPSIYFSSIVKSRSNPFLEPTTVLSNKGKVSCSRKQCHGHGGKTYR